MEWARTSGEASKPEWGGGVHVDRRYLSIVRFGSGSIPTGSKGQAEQHQKQGFSVLKMTLDGCPCGVRAQPDPSVGFIETLRHPEIKNHEGAALEDETLAPAFLGGVVCPCTGAPQPGSGADVGDVQPRVESKDGGQSQPSLMLAFGGGLSSG